MGRSGTVNDVRYFAHDSAEMPEYYTKDIISGYARAAANQHTINQDQGTHVISILI